MKEYKKQLIITSIITIVPLFVGLLLWNRLPDTMATHFGKGNIPNGWSSKSFAVLGLPVILLGLHLLAVTVTLNDPKKRNIGKSMMFLVFWIVPLASLVCCIATYAYAMEMSIDIGVVVNLLVGLIFVCMGNYMSKNRQNYTVGIRLPWTLNSSENWNRTHRLASKLWMLSGILFLLNILFQSDLVLLVLLAVITTIPIAYSFFLYKKGI